MSESALTSKTAFISYATKDQEAARSIKLTLEQCGVTCWIAPDDIAPSKDYAEEIIRGIQTSKVVILLLSEHANHSTFVKKEIERAVSKNKPVFPIRLADVQPSPALEFFISSSQWIDAWPTPWGPKIELLAKSIQRLCGEPISPVPTQTQTPAAESALKKPTNAFAHFKSIFIVSLVVFFIVLAGYFYLSPAVNSAAGPGIISALEATPTKTHSVSKESIPQVKKAVVQPVLTVPVAAQPPVVSKNLPPTETPVKNIDATAKPKFSSSQPEICSTILQRASLGETISFEEQKLLKTQCQ